MDLATLFRRRAAQPVPQDHRWRRNVQPRRRDIIRLAEVWAWQCHALLETRDGGVGLVNGGEACDAETLLMVEALLAGAQVRVQIEAHPHARGRVEGMADRVWTGVLCGWSSSAEILARLSKPIWEGPGWGRLPELPVCEQTLAVLAHRRPDKPLGVLLREADVDPGRVANELSALSRLGVVDICDQIDGHAPIQRVQPPPSAADDAPSLGPFVAPVRDRESLLQTLDSLRSRDPWLALGLPRDARRSEILAVAQDLRDRYRPVPSDSPGIVEILSMIRKEVDRTRNLLVKEDSTETEHFSEVILD